MPRITWKNYQTDTRETIALATPIAFAQMAFLAMGLVDMALVGRVSKAELAVVSIGNALLFAIMCPAMGLTMAVEPMAAQSIGMKDEMRAWNSMRAGVFSVLLISIPTLLLAVLSTPLFTLLGVEQALIPLAARYIYVRLPSVPLWLLFLAIKAFIEAKAHPRPLYLMGWLANIVNFIVGAALVLGDRALHWVGLGPWHWPALGSVGAGIATSFANLVLVLGALIAAHNLKPNEARWFGNSDAFKTFIKPLLRIGIPIGLQMLAEIGVFGLSTLVAGRMGASIVAAHQIALSLASFTFMAVIGVGSATAVRVGKAYGARDGVGVARAGGAGIFVGAGYMSGCALFFLLMARPLAALFTNDQAVINIAEKLIRIAAAFQLADGVQGVANGALRGLSDTSFSFLTNLIGHWCIGLPLALYWAFYAHLGPAGLWWGLNVGLYVVSFVLVARFIHSQRKIRVRYAPLGTLNT